MFCSPALAFLDSTSYFRRHLTEIRTPMCKTYLVLSVIAIFVLASCHKKHDALPVTDETTTTPQEVTKENLVGSYLITKVEGRTSAQRSDITDTWFSSYAGNC